jgi:hypothetical protein
MYIRVDSRDSRGIFGGDSPMRILAALLLQVESERPDLTLNWIIISILLAIAAILSIIVVRRRMRERDDDWDG